MGFWLIMWGTYKVVINRDVLDHVLLDPIFQLFNRALANEMSQSVIEELKYGVQQNVSQNSLFITTDG